MEKYIFAGAIVCDKRASDTSAFQQIFCEYGQGTWSLFIRKSWRENYLFYDSVHLRNNLLNQKRFVFLSFDFGRFCDDIHITSEEISWKLLYFVYDNSVELKENLKKTPKISKNVLDSRKFKQNCHSCIRHSMIQE